MFFLGELFLDMELEYDEPIENRCGNCSKCIDACPTGALTPVPGLTLPSFNAEKCLSYQTIENRGDIPSSLAEKMGDSIYGCDRCTHEPLLQPKEELLEMTKEKWQQLTEEDYRRLFKGSAVKRAKYEGLMRNIKAIRNEQDQ